MSRDQLDSKNPALFTLLHALQVIHIEVVHPTLHNVYHIADKVTWLMPELSRRLNLDQLREAHEHLSGINKNTAMPPFHGQTENLWAVSALDHASQSHLSETGVVQLAASLIIGSLDYAAGKTEFLNFGMLDEISVALRAIAKKGAFYPNYFDVTTLPDIKTPAVLADAITAAINAGTSPDTSFAQSWVTKWAAYLKNLPQDTSIETKYAGTPPDPHVEEEPLTNDSPKSTANPDAADAGTRRRKRIKNARSPQPPRTIIRVPSSPTDAIDSPEAPDESAPTAVAITTGVTKKESTPPSPKLAKALALQSIRQQNQSLSLKHIDVLSTTEMTNILPVLRSTIEASLTNGSYKLAAAGVSRELCLASGHDLERVLNIPIGTHPVQESPEGLYYICLETGYLRQPILRPKDAFKPGRDAADFYECVEDYCLLQLPPSVVKPLKQLFERFPDHQCLGDFFEDTRCEAVLKDILDPALPHLPKISMSSARARRWTAARLMEVTTDRGITQLACGDDFGGTTSPLYYYSPTLPSLDTAYRAAIWPTFGDSPTASTLEVKRTGAQGLVKLEVIQSITNSMVRLTDFPRKPPEELSAEDIFKFHNRYVSYVLHYFVLGTTHRPTLSLFELKRFDLDLDGNCAIISDKKIDPAHYFRLIVVSNGLARLLTSYLNHIQYLSSATIVGKEINKLCNDILASRVPLFFFFGSNNSVDRSFTAWKSEWPSQLHNLQSNWYRTSAATYLRESGAAGWAVSTHLGHLEAAGFPFSQESTLRLQVLAAELINPLESVERLFGLEHRRGFQCEEELAPLTLLTDWSLDVKENARLLRKVDVNNRVKLRATLKSNREAGLALALGILEKVSPIFHRVLIDTTPIKTADPAELDFGNKDAVELLERLEASSDNVALKIAAQNQLCSLMRKLQKELKLSLPDIGRVHVFKSADATPFFPGMLLATQQIRELRQFIGNALKNKLECSPDVIAALTMILFGHIRNENQLISLLNNAARGSLIWNQGAQWICPLDDAPNAVGVGLRGLGAVAAVHFSKTQSRSVPVTEKSLSAHLVKTLPKFFSKTKGSTSALQCLLMTASIADRVERSGLARFITSDWGATAAPLSLQAALLTDTAPNPATLPTKIFKPSQENASTPTSSGAVADQNVGVKGSKEFLEQLHNAFYVGGNNSHDRAATAIRAKASLPQLTLHLQDLFATNNAQTLRIEHLLCGFCLEMAEHGTIQKQNPAPATIETYLSAIAKDLIEHLDGVDMQDVDEEDLSEIYTLIAEGRVNSISSARSATQLMEFHDYLVKDHDFQPIPLGQLAPYLSKTASRGIANSTTHAEIQLAKQWILKQIAYESQQPLLRTSTRRLYRQALTALKMFEMTAARFKEILYLRHSDIYVTDDGVVIFIRPWALRNLKTDAGRRAIDSTPSPIDNFDHLKSWISGERIRLGSVLDSKSLLFCSLDDHRAPIQIHMIRNIIIKAFLEGAGRRCWPHLIRHQVVHEAIHTSTGMLADATAKSWWAIQRSLKASSITFGHVSISTSVCNYCHLPWWLPELESQQFDAQGGRRVLAWLTGKSLALVDKRLQRPVTQVSTRLSIPHPENATDCDKFLIPDALPHSNQYNPKVGAWVADDSPSLFRLKLLDELLRSSDDQTSLMERAVVYGLSEVDSTSLLAAIEHVGRIANYRLLPLPTNKGTVNRAPIPRMIDDHGVGGLVQNIDQAPEQLRMQISALFLRTHKPWFARHDCLTGSFDDLLELRDALTQLQVTNLKVKGASKVEPNTISPAILRFDPPDDAVSPFHQLTWTLALTAVLVRMNAP